MDSSERLRAAIETSVLCWLATVDADGQPNVSPKEIFCMGAGAPVACRVLPGDES